MLRCYFLMDFVTIVIFEQVLELFFGEIISQKPSIFVYLQQIFIALAIDALVAI